MTAPFDLVPFDAANEWHQAFVYDTFRHSTNHWPWSELSRPRLQERLRRELGAPGTVTRIATPHGMADSFLGWYSARRPDTVVYAFTKYSARRQGVCHAALLELGVDLNTAIDETPVWVRFWTAAAARMASHQRVLLFDTREAYDDDAR